MLWSVEHVVWSEMLWWSQMLCRRKCRVGRKCFVVGNVVLVVNVARLAILSVVVCLGGVGVCFVVRHVVWCLVLDSV